MSAHDEHTSLDGYDPEQLLHDGCVECERRSEHVDASILMLDPERFVRAWTRAGELQMHGLRNVSQAELPMLRALAAVQVQLEYRGWPLAIVPMV